MSNSLSDQLLKAGLIDQKKAQKAQKNKHKARVQETKNLKKRDRGKASELDQKLQAEQLAKQERDRELNAARKAEAEQKALAAQARQIIETHEVALPDLKDDSAIDYNFADDKLVCKLLVSNSQHRQLGQGSLAIARLEQGYALIPGVIADRVSARYAEAIVVRHESDETPDEDDPYAAYEVPDDLMW